MIDNLVVHKTYQQPSEQLSFCWLSQVTAILFLFGLDLCGWDPSAGIGWGCSLVGPLPPPPPHTQNAAQGERVEKNSENQVQQTYTHEATHPCVICYTHIVSSKHQLTAHKLNHIIANPKGSTFLVQTYRKTRSLPSLLGNSRSLYH